jgi:mRNA-degrading endonuclease RelE of RelBE toxin-antitoxin system
MNWNLLVTGNARKELAKLPDRDQRQIVAALQAMEADPFGGDIKRLHPSGWRRRVGNYRVFYDLYLEDRRVVVTTVKRRTSATY